ncbi:hypothetical protein GJ496_008021 [Pomphorhynchus laevis]|nr:hypothetical protein GJ496_008021 [Pomphorhynchus laevis]
MISKSKLLKMCDKAPRNQKRVPFQNTLGQNCAIHLRNECLHCKEENLDRFERVEYSVYFAKELAKDSNKNSVSDDESSSLDTAPKLRLRTSRAIWKVKDSVELECSQCLRIVINKVIKKNKSTTENTIDSKKRQRTINKSGSSTYLQIWLLNNNIEVDVAYILDNLLGKISSVTSKKRKHSK